MVSVHMKGGFRKVEFCTLFHFLFETQNFQITSAQNKGKWTPKPIRSMKHHPRSPAADASAPGMYHSKYFHTRSYNLYVIFSAFCVKVYFSLSLSFTLLY